MRPAGRVFETPGLMLQRQQRRCCGGCFLAAPVMTLGDSTSRGNCVMSVIINFNNNNTRLFVADIQSNHNKYIIV